MHYANISPHVHSAGLNTLGQKAANNAQITTNNGDKNDYDKVYKKMSCIK